MKNNKTLTSNEFCTAIALEMVVRFAESGLMFMYDPANNSLHVADGDEQIAVVILSDWYEKYDKMELQQIIDEVEDVIATAEEDKADKMMFNIMEAMNQLQ